MNEDLPQPPYTNVEIYLAAMNGQYTGELPTPITRIEEYLYYLAKNGVAGGVTSGYYYNGKFYEDVTHTKEITPKENGLYYDKTTNMIYIYVEGEYVLVGGGSSFVVEVVDELPATGSTGVLYLLTKQGGEAPDYCEEYVWVAQYTRYELVGSTAASFNTRTETWIDINGTSTTVVYHTN